MDIAVLLFDGFDTLDALGPFEVFSHGRRAGAGLEVSLVTLEPDELVTSGQGIRIVPDGTLSIETGDGKDRSDRAARDTIGPADLIVVPGGGWADRATVGAWAEAQRGAIPETLARLHEEGATMASVCTGGMLLAEAGLTDSRPAVTHHEALDELAASGATVIDSRVVDDGDIITAGGITAGIDLALYILEREFGREVAESVEETMEYERRGSVHTE